MGLFSVWVPLGSMFIMGTSGFFFNVGDPYSYHNVFWFVVVLLAHRHGGLDSGHTRSQGLVLGRG